VPGVQPSPVELQAFAIVEKVLGVEVEPWDTQTADRQGAVDGHLHYLNGHQAAMEVSRLGDEAELEFDAIMAAQDSTWPWDGAWWWTATLTSTGRLDRLRSVYAGILRQCEDHGVRTGWELPAEQRRDRGTDLHWLLYESDIELDGHPSLPNLRDDGTYRGLDLWTGGIGGQIDRPMATFAADLAAALATPRVSGKLAKLLRDPLPERHLYLRVEMSGLPFPSYDALLMACGPPSEPPPLPEGITHLWLMPALGATVLGWSPVGWTYHALD
jgi:hypothetical protein